MGRRRSLCLAGLFLLPLLVRLLLFAWTGPPLAAIHDEFSYLLAGDTFASGRLANPPHPLWEHFETFHVIQKPTYSSKYPPGQGLALALGQRLTGQPWFGVAASYAAMLALFWWAARAWLRPPWAAVACALAVVRYPIYHYWLNSYWGGAVAAAGGALLLGGAGRMRDRIRAAPAAAAGLGLAVLALSRPYEGLVFAVALLGPVAPVILKRREQWPALVPGVAILAAGLAFYARLNQATTGSPFLPAYIAHERQYSHWPVFLFRYKNVIPAGGGDVLRPDGTPSPGFWGRVRDQALRAAELVRPGGRTEEWVNVGYGVALWGAVPLVWRDRRRRLLAAAVCLMFVGVMLPTAYHEHYAAPAAGLKILVITAGARRLAVRMRGPILAACAAAILLQTAAYAGMAITGKLAPSGFRADRAAVAGRLASLGGRHLVIVRYSAGHNPHEEWVQNAADIDASPVVWARDKGEQANRRLLDYFKDRAVWLLEPDREPRNLRPQQR